MFRCAACGAALGTIEAMSSNRDMPLACAGCGLRQFAPAVHWPAVIVVALVLALLAAWLPVDEGIDAFGGWVLAVVAVLAVDRFDAFRRGRMRAWSYSARRAWGWLAYYLLFAAAAGAAALYGLAGYPLGEAEGPMARVEGVVRQVSFDCRQDCACVTLVDRSERFSLDTPHARRLMGTTPPDTLRAGAAIVLHVPVGELADRPEHPRRVFGLRIGDDIVFEPRHVAEIEGRGRQVIVMWGVLGGLLFGVLAWIQRRSMRADAAYAASRPAPGGAGGDGPVGRPASGTPDAE